MLFRSSTARNVNVIFAIMLLFLSSIPRGCIGSSLHLFKRLQKKLAIATISTIFVSIPTIMTEIPSVHAATQVVVDPSDLQRLKRGLAEINYLLSNWDEKTTYCNFGQFKNELLTAENKALLLEAAKEPVLLYDKSATMRVMCKKDPEVVRAFLGLTKENLVLSQADALMKKASTVDLVDPDAIDEYFEAVDSYLQASSAADSLAYQSRTEYASTENFPKEDLIANSQTLMGKETYLSQSKAQVVLVRDALDKIVKALHL